MGGRLTAAIGRLRRDQRGGALVMLGVALPALMMAAGVVIDYGVLSEQRTAFQTVADGSALAAAREFRLANATPTGVQSAAEKFATTQLKALNQTGTIAAAVDVKKMTVTVEVTNVARTNIMHMFGSDNVTISARATARVLGTAAICVIGLETSKKETIHLEKDAKLEAPECAVYSNSTSRDGLKAMHNSQLRARFICSAGGSYKDKHDSFQPSPTLDCPVLADPLASRPPPSIGGCSANDLKITSTTMLSPGTYCGGVRIGKGAVVTLNPGVYVFKDGPLDVSGGATLKGANVGIYLNGKGAVLRFDADTKIDLTAPQNGVMAGILFFEDRSSPVNQKHEILSNDAKVLLGTLYFPQGELNIGASKPVAAESAYTIVVARRFTLSAGPTMVLNAKYSSTNIPVPEGVGPGSTAAHLAR
ncbi:MAG: pilus assembly protein [Bosea sp. (in: a-proteobacteria)]|uniref:TadE/TadG family type IV pilus assembly protein n=1 Tax=Bosea sp. (in: a-proteobacteria) TaxID=1871050 RepID=UPI0027374AF1|nr:TadE/TadG family type IV pilus assembly protein [Bosea sp. (in: a-proteobacteria)]MDP3254580.1 pilus assembly protein [Bosea sp. (in: a-proteobacteria)]MDP3318505.1 pilus assembly protein [Bosea sp. (in: a-proteobacteria)]